MKKIIIVLAFTIPVLTQAQKPTSKNGYKLEMGFSLIGGIQNNKNFETSTAVYGVEFAFQCPLINTKKNYIRQQISLIRQEGTKLKTISVELNPQYKIIPVPALELGVGPSAGLIFANTTGKNKPVFNYGLGASIVWTVKNFFIGLESRYAFTKKVSFTDVNNKEESMVTGNLNNLRTSLKFGYKF